MPDNSPQWIIIPGWQDKFQHYRDRTPIWIKVYTELLDREDYLELSFATRAVLHDLWLLYARSRGILRADPKRLSSKLGATVYRHQLERLNQAGFIQFSASKPLSLCSGDASPRALAREEKSRERKDAASTAALTGGSRATRQDENGTQRRPLYHVMHDLVRNLATDYPDHALLDEFAIAERKHGNGEHLTDQERDELLEYAHELRGEA